MTDSAVPRFGELSVFARDALNQLFVFGPIYDGHLVSKTGRDELVALGLVDRGQGFLWLTRAGMEVCLSPETLASVCLWRDRRWYTKGTCS